MKLSSLPAVYLGPNCGGANEDDNGNLLQKVPCTHCCTQCPWPCSRPLPTPASVGDSWTLTGKSESVSCGITAPFSWVLVSQVLFVSSKSLFPQSCVSFVIKSHWPPKSNSLGFLSPFARSPGWKIHWEVTTLCPNASSVDLFASCLVSSMSLHSVT